MTWWQLQAVKALFITGQCGSIIWHLRARSFYGFLSSMWVICSESVPNALWHEHKHSCKECGLSMSRLSHCGGPQSSRLFVNCVQVCLIWLLLILYEWWYTALSDLIKSCILKAYCTFNSYELKWPGMSVCHIELMCPFPFYFQSVLCDM